MKRRRKKPEQDWLGLTLLIAFGVVVVALASVLFFYLPHQARLGHEARRVPPFFATAAAAEPLPAVLESRMFDEPRIQSAYAMARQKPAILAQQPCYCGCDRQGHRSLLDCFKSEHAAKCSICIREANYAREQDANGKCAVDIRNNIIRTDWKSLENRTQ
jgi:hypothetical protein